MKKIAAQLPQGFAGASDGLVDVSIQAKGMFEQTFARPDFLAEAGVTRGDNLTSTETVVQPS